MQRTLSLIFSLLLTLAASASLQGRWQLHASLDAGPSRVIDARDCVYILSRADAADTEGSFLFRLDKATSELRPLTTADGLSASLVDFAAYNAASDYLLLAYSDGRIDFLFPDGAVQSLDALAQTPLRYEKRVKHASFDPERNRVWLATQFGYVELDDASCNVAESRVYGQPLLSAGRVGPDVVLIDSEGRMLRAPYQAPRAQLSDYSRIETPAAACELMPLSNTGFAFLTDEGVWIGDNASGQAPQKVMAAEILYVQPTSTGYYLHGSWAAGMLTSDGRVIPLDYAPSDRAGAAASRDMRTFYLMPRRGSLLEKRYDAGAWTTAADYGRPDAAAAFISRGIVHTPSRGYLLARHGVDRVFPANTTYSPPLLSQLQAGRWSVPDPAFRSVSRPFDHFNASGIAVDPDNPDLIYLGSYYSGLLRLNLADAEDILHFAHPADPDAGKRGFVSLVPTQSWAEYCNFAAPSIDSEGNLWTAFDSDCGSTEEGVWVWPADARRRGDTSGWKHLPVRGYEGAMSHIIRSMRTSDGNTLLILAPNTFSGPMFLIDTRGTPADATDDVVVRIDDFSDTSGATIDHRYFYDIKPDASTGRVWVATATGVFHFSAAEALHGPFAAVRPKVARSDGSGLADYLLDGVEVYSIAIAPGRKWFGTGGAGLVATSADGTQLLAEFSPDNSGLPGSSVYSVAADAESGDIMVSTDAGLAQFYPAEAPESAGASEMHIYPNPVRPDYYGNITVDMLPDNTYVRIIDAKGGFVRDLGATRGGSVQWDVRTAGGKRVAPGVYFIIAEPASGGKAAMGKILIAE